MPSVIKQINTDVPIVKSSQVCGIQQKQVSIETMLLSASQVKSHQRRSLCDSKQKRGKQPLNNSMRELRSIWKIKGSPWGFLNREMRKVVTENILANHIERESWWYRITGTKLIGRFHWKQCAHGFNSRREASTFLGDRDSRSYRPCGGWIKGQEAGWKY